MDILKTNSNFGDPIIIDEYSSFIWNDRYSDAGDFELVIPVNSLAASTISYEDILSISLSQHSMLVEDISIQNDSIDGQLMKITGSSLESILKRRIVWEQTTLTGKIEDGIKKLLDDNIIFPKDPLRKISNFIFEPSDDPRIGSIKIDTQFTGDNLYDAITDLCYNNDIGFIVYLNDLNQFVFKLYKGVDRSYSQTDNQYVVFSTEYDNLISSDFYGSVKDFKNMVLVAGEGEGTARSTIAIGDSEASGLNRRELYSDARDISSDTLEGQLTEDEYFSLLAARGLNDIYEYKIVESFDGKCDATGMYKFNEHFFMGDIVQIEDDYGHAGGACIVEMIISDDTSGFQMYPTFELI